MEVVGKECGKLDLLIDILNLSSVCIGSFWFQGIHLGSQAVKPSLALTSCSPHISSPTAVRHWCLTVVLEFWTLDYDIPSHSVRKVCFSVVLRGLGLLHMNKSSSNFTGKERMIGLPIKISHFPSALSTEQGIFKTSFSKCLCLIWIYSLFYFAHRNKIISQHNNFSWQKYVNWIIPAHSFWLISEALSDL